MPWDTNDKLPDSIKNSLPADAQTVWRNAANVALKSGKSEEDAVKIGWIAVKNAGWQKDGDTWKKQTNNAKLFDLDMEVFSAGVWNGDKYTTKDIDAIVSSFEQLKDRVKPPVKLGHNVSSKINKPIEDGQPALGWVKSLKRVGDKLVASLTAVPEIVRDAIADGRYKRVSAEIYFGFKDATGKIYDRVLKAISLLGADIPAVDNLEDLAAYLTANGKAFDKVAAYDFDFNEEREITTDTQNNNGGLNMADDMKVYKDKIKELEAEIAKLTSTGENAKNEIEALRKFKLEIASKTKKDRKEEFTTFCNKLVEAGKMTPAVRDEILKENVLAYSEESQAFSIPFSAFAQYANTVERLIEFDEKGRAKDPGQNESYDHAPTEVDRRANELISKGTFKRAEYSQAVAKVLTDDAQLAEMYATYNKDN